MYRALETGRVDALLVPPSVIRSFKIGEVAKFFTTGLGAAFGRSPFFLVMNKRTFSRLSKTHQDLIDKTTGREMSIRASKFYMFAGKKSLDKVRNSDKHEVITLTGSALQSGINILMASRARQVEEFEKKGLPAKAILKAMGVTGS